jgi:heme-degrading monooxygenase HmoA
MTDDARPGQIFQVVGRFNLRPGAEATWDSAFRDRVETATAAPGWLGVATWAPVAEPSQRIVVGRWRSRADYEAWTLTESYLSTKATLDSCQTAAPDIEWFRSVLILDTAEAAP